MSAVHAQVTVKVHIKKSFHGKIQHGHGLRAYGLASAGVRHSVATATPSEASTHA